MTFDPLVDVRTEYLRFTEIPFVVGKQKTRAWLVFSEQHGDLLGKIKWFGRWRQYAFFPEPGTVWNNACLADVTKFLGKAMADWRERRSSTAK